MGIYVTPSPPDSLSLLLHDMQDSHLGIEKTNSTTDDTHECNGSHGYGGSKNTTIDPHQVTLEPEDDPKNLPLWRKWLTVAIINAGAMNATGASSMVREVNAESHWHQWL